MLNGIVNLDKLTKYYKKLGNGVEELFHTIVQHMIVLITRKIFNIDDVISIICDVILSELTEIHPNLLNTSEDKSRISRKIKQLLKESVLIEMESVSKTAESVNVLDIKNDKNGWAVGGGGGNGASLSIVSNIAPPPVPPKPTDISFSNNNNNNVSISAINHGINQKGKAFTPYNNKNVSIHRVYKTMMIMDICVIIMDIYV